MQRNAKMEKKLKDFQFKSEFFGSGKGKNEHWWKAFGKLSILLSTY